MSFLTTRNLLFAYLNLDSTLSSVSASSPDGYTQAQITAAISGRYQSIAAGTKCVEAVETVSISATNPIYSHTLPTGYLDTFRITPSSTKDSLERVTYSDFGMFDASSARFFSVFAGAVYFYNATLDTANPTYSHVYWKIPTALSADSDILTFPLLNWERLVALGASLDLIVKNTSQSADTKKTDLKVLFDEEYQRFIDYWSNLQASNATPLSGSRFIAT